MQIVLANYQEGVSVGIQEELDPKKLDLEFVDLEYANKVVLTGEIEKGPDTLSLRGEMVGELDRVCGRCLKKIRESFNKPFSLYFDIQGKDFIDPLDDLREILILDHPVPFLCGENCRGLCPQCGHDLNESRCQCRPDERAGSMASLKEFWDKQKEEKKHAKS
jgi:uncharacterized protein